MADNLKDGNIVILSVYATLHGVALALLSLSPTTGAAVVEHIAGSESFKAVGMFALTIFVTLLNGLVGHDAKAALVFWRLRNALPGFRAFSNLPDGDTRVDKARLKSAVGGVFPEEPADQNRTWYRLYQKFSENGSVVSTHKEYLLFRDLTWITFMLAFLGMGGLMFVRPSAALVYGAASVVLYLFIRRVAAIRGYRFVSTVLAVASVESTPAVSPILHP